MTRRSRLRRVARIGVMGAVAIASTPSVGADSRCPDVPPAVPSPEGIVVTLETPTTTVAPGQPVPLVLRVANTSEAPVDNSRPSSQRYDFWVTGSDGTVWLWSYEFLWTAAVEEETFKPGEERINAQVWTQTRCVLAGDVLPPVAMPGTYTVRGLWKTTGGGWWSNAVTLVIAPGELVHRGVEEP